MSFFIVIFIDLIKLFITLCVSVPFLLWSWVWITCLIISVCLSYFPVISVSLNYSCATCEADILPVDLLKCDLLRVSRTYFPVIIHLS